VTLKEFLQTLSLADRSVFAQSVGSSAGHLRNISYGYRPCSEGLAIEIEKLSAGIVRCEDLCPDVDWSYLRNSQRELAP